MSLRDKVNNNILNIILELIGARKLSGRNPCRDKYLVSRVPHRAKESIPGLNCQMCLIMQIISQDDVNLKI